MDYHLPKFDGDLPDRPDIILPLERELLLYKVKKDLHKLTRPQLEEMAMETLTLMVKLTHQTEQLLLYIGDLELALDYLSNGPNDSNGGSKI